MISGRNARNDPNTQASTSSAPSAPSSNSPSTLELPEVVLPAASDLRLVPCTVRFGAAAFAAPVSASTAVVSMPSPSCGG